MTLKLLKIVWKSISGGLKKMKWNNAKQIINSDPEVVTELKNNAIEYHIVREIIKARTERKMTQKQLALLVGTKQSNISRLESGIYNPSIEFLNKIAGAMGKTLEIRLV